MTTEIRLSVLCMMNGDTPSAIMEPTSFKSGRIQSDLSRSDVFGDVIKRSTQIAPASCDRMVASAAPCTPMWNPKIKIGSKMILSAAPMSTDPIAVFDCPCAVINGFNPSTICTKNVPIR